MDGKPKKIAESKTPMFIKLENDAILPKRHSDGAAGYDLHAINDNILKPNILLEVHTGLHVKCPKGSGWMMFGRSGLALRHMIDVSHTILTEGEIIVYLYNRGTEDFYIKKGIELHRWYVLI